MDMWSVGCCFHELLCLHPLFPGQNEIDQVAKIHDVLGTPSKFILDKFKHRNQAIDFNFPAKSGIGIEKYLPHVSQGAIDVIYKLVDYDFDTRITAKQTLSLAYFRDLPRQIKGGNPESSLRVEFLQRKSLPESQPNETRITTFLKNRRPNLRSVISIKLIKPRASSI